jgi:hypothetical protein
LSVAETAEAEKARPHGSPVTAFTFRVATPWTYIPARLATSARSERRWRSNGSVEKRPSRSCGTRGPGSPTRAIGVRP